MRALVSFEPVDTMFFSDGRPFNQDDDGLAEASSVFPPSPFVISGAVRAAIGAKSGGDWSEELLGNGPFDPGALRFGPLLLSEDQENSLEGFRRYLPAPMHLASRLVRYSQFGSIRIKAEALDFACPSEVSQRTPSWLPTLLRGEHGSRPPEPGALHWIRHRELAQILQGELPKDIQGDVELVRPEPRTGLRRNPASRMALQGSLYQVAHQRPVGHLRMMCLLEAEEHVLDRLSDVGFLPFGGRGRAAIIEVVKSSPTREVKTLHEQFEYAPADGEDYIIVALSPVIASQTRSSWDQTPLGEFPGQCVFALHRKAEFFAPWVATGDGRTGHRGPPLRLIPAGAVWFFKSNGAVSPVKAAELLRQEGGLNVMPSILADKYQAQVRQLTRLGFGCFALGRWPDKAR